VIKVIFCLRRTEGLTLEEFQTYWQEQHGPLVARLAPAMGMIRYVQSRPVPGRTNELIRQSRGSPDPFDGVAEIYFESMATLRAATSTAEGAEAEATLRADEANFIDLARSPFFVVEAHDMCAADA
jgi:uncharacterized protein (TIGR02118 family)